MAKFGTVMPETVVNPGPDLYVNLYVTAGSLPPVHTPEALPLVNPNVCPRDLFGILDVKFGTMKFGSRGLGRQGQGSGQKGGWEKRV